MAEEQMEYFKSEEYVDDLLNHKIHIYDYHFRAGQNQYTLPHTEQIALFGMGPIRPMSTGWKWSCLDNRPEMTFCRR